MAGGLGCELTPLRLEIPRDRLQMTLLLLVRWLRWAMPIICSLLHGAALSLREVRSWQRFAHSWLCQTLCVGLAGVFRSTPRETAKAGPGDREQLKRDPQDMVSHFCEFSTHVFR